MCICNLNNLQPQSYSSRSIVMIPLPFVVCASPRSQIPADTSSAVSTHRARFMPAIHLKGFFVYTSYLGCLPASVSLQVPIDLDHDETLRSPSHSGLFDSRDRRPSERPGRLSRSGQRCTGWYHQARFSGVRQASL